MPGTLVLSMHPAPYRDPVLRSAQEQLGAELEIVTLYPETTHPEWERPEPSYHHVQLGRPRSVLGRFDLHVELFKLLRQGDYRSVVVPGYAPLSSLVAAAYAAVPGRRLIYSADTVELSAIPPRLPSAVMARQADAIWTTGAAGRRFWESRGVPPTSIFEGMYTLDPGEVEAGLGTEDERAALRERLQVDGKFVYLFVGSFLPTRRVPDLVRAFVKVADPDSALILIGSGPDRDEVDSLVADNPGVTIKQVPSVRFGELHRYYGIADAYVHPGAEPYSLAFQEAALLGLCLVCSDQVGAFYDYVVEGQSGLGFAGGDQRGLEEALRAAPDLEVAPEWAERAKARGVEFATGQLLAAIRGPRS